VPPARYEVGFYITRDGILHSHRRENLKSYNSKIGSAVVEEKLLKRAKTLIRAGNIL
jgi:hypothetical protein